jgi:hypothetical protein
MLNISNQNVIEDVWEHVPRQSRPELLRTFASRKLGRILMVMGLVFLVILFLPWRQTIEGFGTN